MDGESNVIVWEPVTGRDRAQRWAEVAPDERRRRAMAAAAEHDGRELFDLLHAYLLVKSRAKTAISRSTLKCYGLAVTQLLAAWRQENLLHPSQDAGDRWMGQLAERLAPASCDVRLRGARALYRALHWARATEADPFGDTRAPRNPTPKHERRRPYRDADIEAMLAVATPAMRAMILVCAHGGLRIGEALQLTWGDVNVVSRTIRVRKGKGGAARTVSMSPSLIAALEAIAAWGYGGPIFMTAYNHAFRDATVPRAALRKVCAAAGVHYLGFHALRHSAGTRLMRESGNLQLVAAHLGHANIATSAIYAKWSSAELAGAVCQW